MFRCVFVLKKILCCDTISNAKTIHVVTFGDMLRVPVNVRKQAIRSLEQAKAHGGKIYPIASPLEAVQLALQHPDEKVIFFVAGFETTTAPVAALLAQGVPGNLLILLAARLTYPAVKMLLETGEAQFDALIAPGHVATVMGSNEWQFVATEHHLRVGRGGIPSQKVCLRDLFSDSAIVENNVLDILKSCLLSAIRLHKKC
ncbi:MAG: hypothetical protein R3E08_06705 [Thiotrichaceae bacterium]